MIHKRLFRISGLLVLALALSAFSRPVAPEEDQSPVEPVQLVVDSDFGVDDAAAVTWLLTQEDVPLDVLGITTVAGNTAVQNAANNALILLEATGNEDIPVVVGAEEPLTRDLSKTGWLIHGPDGLWFVGAQNPHDLSGLDDDVPAFYDSIAEDHPGATLLALGPLTNLSRTLDEYPDALASFERIVILGGAVNGGNTTPVSEYNIWQDPEAAEHVLSSGLPIELVTFDAFSQFTLTADDVQKLEDKGTPAAQLLGFPLEQYVGIQLQGGLPAASVPDVSAAMIALDPSLGKPQSGLVKVITDDGLTRGQTIAGLTFGDRINMLAEEGELSSLAQMAFSGDPNFDLFFELFLISTREPDNAQVITVINADEMVKRFMKDLTKAD